MKAMTNAVVIGVSAGAVDALSTIFSGLPANYPHVIVVVVHVPNVKCNSMIKLLQHKCRLEVVEVEDKQQLESGTIYIAPPDYHVMVEDPSTLSLTVEEPINFCRPSVDVLFETAAEVFKERLVGIVLTGANHDGAIGLATIIEEGGIGIVQEPAEAYASAMPEAAIRACPTAKIMSLEQIVHYLNSTEGCQ